MKSKEEILNQFEPNSEYPSYYHESNILDAMEEYASQSKPSEQESAGVFREALEKISKLKKESLDLGESWYDRLTEAKNIALDALKSTASEDKGTLWR